MSYLVLARKYRPLGFEAMVGQEHVVQALSNALEQQRLHHAYLFTGTRGVGKTTVSRILAKSLNCTGADGQGGITARPCGICEACRDIDNGRFVDYVELDAASNRGVEEITQLLDQAVYKPVVGRFKVYMVDEVHMLSNHAFNAMLKTLEEPPEYLKFVLATTDPQKVPPTVLSRCLQFNLRPMAAATVQDHLVQVLGQEAIAAEAGALRLIARAARGSMRDALSLTDQAIAFGGGRIEEAGVRQMLGAVDRGHAVRLLDALAAADGPALLAAADGLRALGLSAPGTLEEMAELLQQMAVAQAVPSAAEGDPEQAEAVRLAGLFGADETALMYSMCLHGRAELGLAPDEHGALVMVLLRMLAFRPSEGRPSAQAPAGNKPAQPLQAPQVAKAQVALVAPASTPPMAVRQAAALAAAPGPVHPLAPVPVPAPLQDRTPPVRATAPSTPPDAGEMPPWLDVPDDAGPPDEPTGPAAAEEAESAPSHRALPTPGDVGTADRPRTPPAAARTPRQALPAPAAVVPPAPVRSATERLSATPEGDRWAEIVADLINRGSVGALVRELAWQAQCVAVEPATAGQPAVWRLRVEREMLRATATVERLQAAMADALQHAVRIETEAGAVSDTPALRAAAERERRQREAEAAIADDPLVRSLLAQYKTARIVPGSIQPC
jgi:DNA polymerase III subunit gamma/tau